MIQNVNPLAMLATAPATTDPSSDGTWFQAMADAWGKTLDSQAARIETLSGQIGAGGDQPSALTQMSAESLKMSFLSQSSHTAITSTGEALKTMAQKS
jgi:hypothetical protein